MLQIEHSESRDIDLFLDDPQLLPLLNPMTQGMRLEHRPDSYSGDGVRTLKLSYSEFGEIDFICCADILDRSTTTQTVRGHQVALETPAEVIAKKVHYRGSNFQPRDMFDLSAVVEASGADYLIEALRSCGRARIETALRTVERANPIFVRTINRQLMVRERARHLTERAQDISQCLFKRILADLKPKVPSGISAPAPWRAYLWRRRPLR